VEGVPLRAIQKLMGHKSITTTERYAHPTGKRIEGLVRTFTDEMLSAPIFHPLNNTKRSSKKRMPTIVNGGGLKNVRIM